jgi:uncharacterized protein YydD (DUF2326 family)
MTTMTADEREQWNERVSIMLAEFNPAGMTDAEVDAAHERIEAVATQQILDQRQRNIEQRAKKKQGGFKFTGAR